MIRDCVCRKSYAYMCVQDRNDALRMLELGDKPKTIAVLFKVTEQTIRNLIKGKHKKMTKKEILPPPDPTKEQLDMIEWKKKLDFWQKEVNKMQKMKNYYLIEFPDAEIIRYGEGFKNL